MFCPKCGSQNADDTKFCRGCGADLSSVLAVVDGRAPAALPVHEREIELISRGWRGLIAGLGFLIVSGLGFGLSSGTWVFGFFGLMFGFFFLAISVSRFVQAQALRSLRDGSSPAPPPTLLHGQHEYLQPARSLFDTDDLTASPQSITEHTTTRLELDREPNKS